MGFRERLQKSMKKRSRKPTNTAAATTGGDGTKEEKEGSRTVGNDPNNSSGSTQFHVPLSSVRLSNRHGASPLLKQLEALHEALQGVENESDLMSMDEYEACLQVHKDLQRILNLGRSSNRSSTRSSHWNSNSNSTSNQQTQQQQNQTQQNQTQQSTNSTSNDNNNGMDSTDSLEEEPSRRKPVPMFEGYKSNPHRHNNNTSIAIPIGNQTQWESQGFVPADFCATFDRLQEEIEAADAAAEAVLERHPAATRPLSPTALQDEVKDFFVLDNSLRETTVGAPRGHTLEEKHKIVSALAKTSLQEIILGAFGSKISVCSQIAEQWQSLGKSYDSTWGFSECYDLEPFQEDGFWENHANPTQQQSETARTSAESHPSRNSAKSTTSDQTSYYTPEHVVKTTYDPDDLVLMKKASSGFRKQAFGRNRKLADVLKKASSADGRIPLGLLMLKGYGICNAILEIDTSVETFDYQKYNIVDRLKFLIKWCHENLAKRPSGEPTRVLINLRDFSNYHRSRGGLQNCLYLVDALCRLPPSERPFGFMIEEPTGWLFPSEVGRICRMLKLTMDRAGFADAKFLIHSHWYFGLAEATQLQALCNGCNGVWGAVCKTGAQTGHACSTMTAVNLYRAGIDYPICDHYNLEEMCEAARTITEIVTRKPCDTHEEIYGSHAFDIPYFMVSLPSCRYSIYQVLEKIGVKERAVRLNTLSMVSSIYHAMVYYFGPPQQAGWNPRHCRKMHDAIHNHLLTGLSRDYNSPLGLGHLYGLVSREKLPAAMVVIMMQDSKIPDTHPVVMDFIFRWNRLCELYETGTAPPHPAEESKSMMFWGIPLVLEPRLESLPFEFFTADVMRNKVLEPIPNLFKLQVVNLLTNDERKIQNRKIPEINFFESMLRLKLFLQEADSLHVLGLVDDFCIRKNHDFFFGEDALWLKQMHGERPNIATKVLLNQMKLYHKHYIHQGNTAISRCIEASADRIDQKRSVPADMKRAFSKTSAKHLVHEIAEHGWDIHPEHQPGRNREKFDTIVASHERMLRALAEDDGEDQEMALEISAEFMVTSKNENDTAGESKSDTVIREQLADEYVKYRRDSLLVCDAVDLVSSEFLCSSGDDTDVSGSSACIRKALFEEERAAKVLLNFQESKL